MATNEVYRNADSLPLPVPANTPHGAPVKVGALLGVTLTDRDENGAATVRLKGAFDFTVDGAVTQVGSPVYIADGDLSTNDAGDLYGYALATKTAPAAPIPVRIAQV